tara:strand:- start:318 stop:539 length:222 start_codon:yes stop_codon:yes gene_type:complete
MSFEFYIQMLSDDAKVLFQLPLLRGNAVLDSQKTPDHGEIHDQRVKEAFFEINFTESRHLILKIKWDLCSVVF